MGTDDGPDFDAYVRASGPRLKRLAFLLSNGADDAEDLLQSAYARLLPKWDSVRRYDDPDAYVRRVMVNLRTSWWRRSVTARNAPVPVQRAMSDPADAVTASSVLAKGLAGLPPRQRAAVVLRFYCDLSEAETARVMNVSVGTVKSTTSRALAALRLSVPQPGVPTPPFGLSIEEISR